MAWFNGRVTQSCSSGYFCDGSVEGGMESGVDILVRKGEPITSVSSGTVVGAGYHLPGNFVVTVRGHVPYFGRTLDLYYQHLQDITVRIGDKVFEGQVVGHGGALANIEFGLNPGAWPGGENGGRGWGGVWGSLPHPGGQSINPVNSGFLDAIKSGTQHNPAANSSAFLRLLSLMGGPVTLPPNPLKPTDDLTIVLHAVDNVFEVLNPFDPGNYGPLPHDQIFNFDFTDPVAAVGGVLNVLWIDVVAIVLRLILIVIGASLVWTVINNALQISETIGKIQSSEIDVAEKLLPILLG